MESLAPLEKRLLGEAIDLRLLKQIATIKSQSAARITWHSHECFELLMIVDGATTYEFAGGSKVELSGGNFLLVPPGVRHRGHHDVRGPVQLTGLMFDPLDSESHRCTPFSAESLAWLVTQFTQGTTEAFRMNRELHTLVRSLPKDFAAVQPSDVATVTTLRISICSILLECAKVISQRRAFEHGFTVQNAIRFMKENLSQPAKIEQIARSVHCSRTKLFADFKESTGMTPVDYWQRLRIEYAQQLLADSQMSITNIAFNCGFSTSQYFSSVFRKYSGYSPREYRQLNNTRSAIDDP